MSDPGVSEKLKVFISYSRRDSSEFADELVAGLELAGFAPFLDRHDISAGEDWEARLGGLIAQSDTVVFVVTPGSVKSQRCVWEVDQTVVLSKRLIPVVHKTVPDSDIPQQLSRLQFVRFDSGRGLNRPLAELAEALRIDLDWIREHTRLSELAARWQARGKAESILLRGDDLDAAKTWVARRKAGAPEITEAQRAFLQASDEAEGVRLSKERAQLEEMRLAQAATARHQKRAGRLLWVVASLMLALFGYVTWQSYDVSRREMVMFTSLATQAVKDDRYDRAMRYALQAYPARGSLPWFTPFSSELEGRLAGSAQSSRLNRVFKGHSDAVNVVEFSPDGKRLLTASTDATARIWDLDSGREIVVMKGHKRGILTAVLSPDGTRVVTASNDSTARIWDASSGREIAVLAGHERPVRSAVFSPDGTRIVTASEDLTARLWDAENGRQLSVFAGHEQLVSMARFSPDGRRVVTAAWDNTVRLWDAESSREIAVLKGYEGLLTDASFSPDGRRIIAAGLSGTRLWETDSYREIAILEGRSSVFTWAVFSPDSRWVVTASPVDDTVRIWDAETGRELEVLRGHPGFVKSVRFGADGMTVVSSSSDFTVRLKDRNGAAIVLKGHTKGVSSAKLSPDGRLIATASEDGTARLWDVQRREQHVALEGSYRPRSAVLNADGQRVVTSADDGSLRVWDAESGKLISMLSGHTGRVWHPAFSPDGHRVVTASADRTARLWDADSGRELAVLSGHTRAVLGAAFSPNGKRVVTASEDGTARIWDVTSARETAVLKGHTDEVVNAAFSPDGKRVVTVAIDSTARLWDAEDGRETLVLKGHTGWVESAAFSADGKRLVTASRDQTVRLWDAISGKELVVFRGHTSQVTSAKISLDGKRVVTAGADAVRLWDAVSGKEIAILGDSYLLTDVVIGPNAHRVKGVSMDSMVRQWDTVWAMTVTGDELRERVCSEALVGAAQEFDAAELEDPILRGTNDMIARNPCLRRGPLSLDYWTRLAGDSWRSLHRLAGAD